MRDRKKEKLWQFYHQNGQLKEETSFREGRAFQNTKMFYSNGKEQLTGFYNELGNRESNWRFYYENGYLHSTGNFENGELIGKWTYYSEKGGLQSEEFYNDVQLATQKEYGENGQLVSEINFYPSGVRREERARDTLSTMKWIYRLFYENGQLEMQGKKISSYEVGKWQFWYQSGAKYAAGSFPDLPKSKEEIKPQYFEELPQNYQFASPQCGKWTFWDHKGKVILEPIFDLKCAE